MTVRGRVKNGVIVLENSTPSLPEGTLVEITALEQDETQRTIAAGKRSPQVDVFSQAGVKPPSEERQAALLELIGMWKIDNPPDDEEVERIIEQERMKKYG
jgi:hypothetical protein